MSYIQAHLADKPHWVYQIFDEGDNLLYIGCTVKHPRDRIVSLRGENPTVARAPLHHWKGYRYPDGETAEAMEGRLIDIYKPPLNRHRSGVASRNWRPIVSHEVAESGLVPAKGRWPERRYA